MAEDLEVNGDRQKLKVPKEVFFFLRDILGKNKVGSKTHKVMRHVMTDAATKMEEIEIAV